MVPVIRHSVARSKRGFTLIEVLVATFIFATLTTAIIGVATLGTRTAIVSEQRTVAQAIANERAEIVGLTPYDDVGTIDGDPDGIFEAEDEIVRNNQEYTVSMSVELIDDPENGLLGETITEENADYKEVFISVSPPSTATSQQDVQVGVISTPVSKSALIISEQCSADSECASNENCCGGQCRIACTDDSTCGAGFICAADGCGCVAAECVDDADCGPGQSCCGDGCMLTCNPADCDSGVCAADGCGCDPVEECTDSSDCAPGDVCCAEGCVPECDAGDCGSGYQCATDGCGCEPVDPPECIDNTDCPTGLSCCGDGCTPTCQPSDCDDGYECAADGCGCQPVGCIGADCECTDAGDCSGGQACCSGGCQNVCTPGQCPTGYECAADGCGCDPIGGDPCTIDTDCEPGLVCSDAGTCEDPSVPPSPPGEPPVVGGGCPGPTFGPCLGIIRWITYFIQTGDSCIPFPVPVFCGGIDPTGPVRPGGGGFPDPQPPSLICCQDECELDSDCPDDVVGECKFNPVSGECGRFNHFYSCSAGEWIPECRTAGGDPGPGGASCTCQGGFTDPDSCLDIDPNNPGNACPGGILCCPIDCPASGECPNGNSCTPGSDTCAADPRCGGQWGGYGKGCELEVVFESPAGCSEVSGECVDDGGFCGDGLCVVASGEDVDTCPEDCS